MIGIVIAMEAELNPFLRSMGDYKRIEIGGKSFFLGSIGSRRVVIVLCGVGKVNASYACTLLLELFRVEFLVSAGVSGGLGRLEIGSIVVADRVVQFDCDTTALGDTIGLVSTINKVYFDTDSKLSSLFCGLLGTKVGTVACGDIFVANASLAKSIVLNFNAVACDMESGAVAQVAFIARVPLVVVRCISDDALPDAPGVFNGSLDSASGALASGIVSVIRELSYDEIT